MAMQVETPTRTMEDRSIVTGPAHASGSLWRDPRYQAFWMLRLAFAAFALAMGIDKFFNGLVYWPMYLAHWIANIPPGTPQQIMYGVGVVEIVAAVLVLLKPRYGVYVLAAWLAGIVVNLLSYSAGTTSPPATSPSRAAPSYSGVSPRSTTRRSDSGADDQSTRRPACCRRLDPARQHSRASCSKVRVRAARPGVCRHRCDLEPEGAR